VVTLTVEPAAGGAVETIEKPNVVLVSIGRRPKHRRGLAARQGRACKPIAAAQIETDHDFRTKVAGLSGRSATSSPGPMLAHKAEDERHRGRRRISPA